MKTLSLIHYIILSLFSTYLLMQCYFYFFPKSISNHLKYLVFGGISLISYLFYYNCHISPCLIFFTFTVLICLAISFAFLFDYKKGTLTSKKDYSFTIFLLICCMSLYRLTFQEQGHPFITETKLCILYLIEYYLVHKYNQIRAAYPIIVKHSYMVHRITMYQDYLTTFKESHVQIAHLRHDLKNYLITTENLFPKEEVPKTVFELDNIYKQLCQLKGYSNTGNYEIDSILNYQLKRATKLSCKIDTTLMVPNTSFMPEMDLHILLNYMLDTAINTLAKSTLRILQVCISYHVTFLTISIRYSFEQYTDPSKTTRKAMLRHFLKQDKTYHLANAVLKKYQGDFFPEIQQNLFHLNAILYIGQHPHVQAHSLGPLHMQEQKAR